MNDPSNAHALKTLPSLLLLAIAYLGFISIGLPDSIAGVAWPSVRTHFGLQQSSFGLIFIALGFGYCISGFLGGKLNISLGLGNVLWISSGLVAIALFGFSFSPLWPVFVVCAIIWGLGSGGIDAGLNSYSAHHFSPLQMNWLHACYSIGATIGPLLMTIMLHYSSWRIGYMIVGGVLFALMVPFFITRSHWNDPVPVMATESTIRVGLRGSLAQPLVWLQMFLFFLFVGLEFTLGQWSFTILTEARNVPDEIAGPMAGCYYGMIGVGRIIAGVIASNLGLDLLIRCAMVTALLGTMLFVLGPFHEVAFVGLALSGLGLAPMFPCLMARTPQRLGADYSVHAIGFQASAGMGGVAVFPGVAGVLSDRFGLEFVPRFAVLLAGLLIVTHEIILAKVGKH